MTRPVSVTRLVVMCSSNQVQCMVSIGDTTTATACQVVISSRQRWVVHMLTREQQWQWQWVWQCRPWDY